MTSIGHVSSLEFYPACACTAEVKQCLPVWVCRQKYIENANASSRVAKAYTDVIVYEKQTA